MRGGGVVLGVQGLPLSFRAIEWWWWALVGANTSLLKQGVEGLCLVCKALRFHFEQSSGGGGWAQTPLVTRNERWSGSVTSKHKREGDGGDRTSRSCVSMQRRGVH